MTDLNHDLHCSKELVLSGVDFKIVNSRFILHLRNSLYLAYSDTRARYKKSVIGPLWLTLGNIIGILGLTLIWASLLNEDIETFVPSVTVGLILWQFISGSISEGSATFVLHGNIIKNVVIPKSFFVMRCFFRQLINFLHNSVILLALFIYFDFGFGWNLLYSPIGLLLVMFNLYWIIFLLGFIEVVRGPLLHKNEDWSCFYIMIGFLVIGSCLTFLINRYKGKQLPYWV